MHRVRPFSLRWPCSNLLPCACWSDARCAGPASDESPAGRDGARRWSPGPEWTVPGRPVEAGQDDECHRAAARGVQRRIETQAVLPSAEAAVMMLFWALLAQGQLSMRKIDGWQSLAHPLADSAIDLAACRW